MTSVLGERWLAAIIWPLADSPLPSSVYGTEEDNTADRIRGVVCNKSSNGEDVAPSDQSQKLTRRNVDPVGAD